MLIKSSASISSSEIADKRLYMDRRTFMRSATALATAGAMLGADALVQAAQPAVHGKKLEKVEGARLESDAVERCRNVPKHLFDTRFKGLNSGSVSLGVSR